jgi:hypothetical protein
VWEGEDYQKRSESVSSHEYNKTKKNSLIGRKPKAKWPYYQKEIHRKKSNHEFQKKEMTRGLWMCE